MGERKVLNKYIPPDFDPAALPRRKMPKNMQIVVRMMLPMSIRCNTCGNYIYKGTKFNCRKEDVEGEDYLGIRVFRFYFKCTRCSAEMAMKTDPKNSDYIMEAGASRNFEPWRDNSQQEDIAKAQREAEETGDAMRALENRTLESKNEMDILAALDEMKSVNSMHAAVTHDQALAAVTRRKDAQKQEEEAQMAVLNEEDEAAVKAVFKAQTNALVRRLDDEDDTPSAKRNRNGVADVPASALLSADDPSAENQDANALLNKPTPGADVSFGIKSRSVKFAVKAKSTSVNDKGKAVMPISATADAKESQHNSAGGLSSLLGAYGSGSEDSSGPGSP